MTLAEGYIAGDIGGTKTNLGCFVPGRARPKLLYSASFPSRDFSDLESILALFLDQLPHNPVAGACFGIAGPVVNGRSRTTNLPWIVSEDVIRRRFHWPRVRLVNDLVATAMAVPVLTSREMASVNPNRIQKSGNLALVAQGTGLGWPCSSHTRAVTYPWPRKAATPAFPPRTIRRSICGNTCGRNTGASAQNACFPVKGL